MRVVLGTVTSLWRYPVKSMQGEEVQRSVVVEQGLLGDRAYALLDCATGKVASAKHPAKWGRLLECQAAFVEEPRPYAPLPAVIIRLPDGTIVSSTQPDVDVILSHWLGRDVTLQADVAASATFEAYTTDENGAARQDRIVEAPLSRAARGALFNYAAVHVLTTATLNRLSDLDTTAQFAIQRFRPNIVVIPAAAERGFVENRWVGANLTVADEVQLRIIDPCPRCVVTTLPHGELRHDPNILRTIARHNAVPSATAAPGVMLRAVAGVYGSVLVSGVITKQAVIELS